MENLEKYYSGNKQWYDAVELFYELWSGSSSELEILHRLNGKVDLAIMIIGKYGGNNPDILNGAIAALNGLSMLDCSSDPKLILRLREMLLRAPV